MIATSLTQSLETWRRPVVNSILAGMYGVSLSTTAYAAQGPGLGNLSYSSSEAFTHVSSPSLMIQPISYLLTTLARNITA